jgi:pimeloyl-ACP methyl ester carboxylesterase
MTGFVNAGHARCLTQLASSLLLAGLLVACGGADSGTPAGGGPPAPEPFSFRAPTPVELAQVQTSWSQRDLAPRDVKQVYRYDQGTYTVTIYTHAVGANTHVGAVVVPNQSFKNPLPVLLRFDGLDTTNPPKQLEAELTGYKANVILVLPLFRGRSLNYRDVNFVATGDFCNGYEGATDDAIAFLNVVMANTPKATTDNLIVEGYSRGGAVALLMGVRDQRVRTVIDGAGPSDFYRQEVANRYSGTYTCQFFTNHTDDSARRQILASSAQRFPMQPSVKLVTLFQGGQDVSVPAWNSLEMQAHLQTQGVSQRYYAYPNNGHMDIWNNATFTDDWRRTEAEAIGLVE